MELTKPRDINHTLRYVGLRAKHLYKEKIALETISLYNGLTDSINSIMRIVLGGVSAGCYLLAELCDKWKEKCIRKENHDENVGGK